jgi:hypothetical protein
MFTVTKAAGLRLAQKLAAKHADAQMVLRFLRTDRGWKLELDEPLPGDIAFVHEGRTVLVLDGEVAKSLANRTLDVRSTHAGLRLALR